MGCFSISFARPEPESEKHDFYCGVDCVCSCEGCSHEVCCESSGTHSMCAGCEWRGGCLKNKEAEIEYGRRDCCCLAG
jgi:hypothetical protein